MEYSEDYNQTKELEMALDKFEGMLKLQQEVFFDVDEIELVVSHFIENGNNNRAKRAIAVGCSQHPYSVDLKIKEAEVLLFSGKSTKALDSLLKLWAIERTNIDILTLISTIFSRQKNHVKAIEFLQQAIKCCDQNERPELEFELGLEYEYSGNFKEALVVFKEILWKQPENDAVGYELLYCFSELEMDTEATEFFQRFVDHNPYSFLGWYNLAICFSKLKLYEKAVQAFDYCILIEPTVSLPYYQKAFMYLELNNYELALATYMDCLSADDNSAILHTYMGECHEKLESYQDAIDCYAKAIEIDEKLPDAWLGIGVVYDLLGNTKNALGYLKKAAEISPSGDYILVYAEALTKSGELEQAEALYKSLEKSENKNVSFWLDYAHFISEKYGLDTALATLDTGYSEVNNSSILIRKAAMLFKFGLTAEGTICLEDNLDGDSEKIEEFLEYYPEGESLELLAELIDLHKNT